MICKPTSSFSRDMTPSLNDSLQVARLKARLKLRAEFITRRLKWEMCYVLALLYGCIDRQYNVLS